MENIDNGTAGIDGSGTGGVGEQGLDSGSGAGSDGSGTDGIASTVRRGRGRPPGSGKSGAGSGGSCDVSGAGGTGGDDGGNAEFAGTSGDTGSDTGYDTGGTSGNAGGKRGRKKKAAAVIDAGVTAQIAMVLVGLHDTIADLTNEPLLKISPAQATGLAEALGKVMDYYVPKLTMNDGQAALLGLGIACAAVYGPKAIMIVKKRKARASNVVPINATQTL